MAWEEVRRLRDDFESLTAKWAAKATWLSPLLDELRIELGYEDYAIETAVVFNEDLRKLGKESEPAFVLVADNPGKKEQLEKNRRYLVGQSGKLAEGWFRRELDLDFRRDVVIINKTPIHTPKTAELRRLLALSGPAGSKRRTELLALLDESQRDMARIARGFHAALGVPLWISGYGELRPRGLFSTYAAALAEEYRGAGPAVRDSVLLFRHFSMNQFAIEMKAKRDAALPLREELSRIGIENRRRILGW